MTSYVTPKNGSAFIFYVTLVDQSNTKLFKSNPTLATGDVKISIDGGALADLATLPTVTPAAGRRVKVSLSGAEMTGDNIGVLFNDAAGAEWCDLFVNIQTSARQIDDLATSASVTTLQADTDDIQTRLPAALVSGRIDASVGAMAANVVTASAIAADAIGASELAADAVTEIQSGLAGAANLATANTNINTLVASITTAGAVADAVWDEALSGHLTSGTVGAALNAAGSAGDPWTTAIPGAYGAGSAGKIIGDRLDATVSGRASQISVDTVDDFLDTEIAAIKAKTDNLPANTATTLTTLQTSVDDIPTNAELATSQAAADDATLAAIAAISVPTVADILAAVVEGSITLKGVMRLMLSVLAGKSSGGGTATITFRDVADAKARVTATVTAAGDRTAITRDITD